MSVFPQGFRVVPAEECWMKSLEPLMREVRAQLGDKPVYISFDIDGLDPAYAPGTGTPEIAGLTPAQVRGQRCHSHFSLVFPCFAPFKGGRSTNTEYGESTVWTSLLGQMCFLIPNPFFPRLWRLFVAAKA